MSSSTARGRAPRRKRSSHTCPIPAQRVIRVEVGPGDLYGSDYSGKSQVLNVILSAQSGIDGNVTAAATRRYTGYINTDISGSALIRRGPSTINLSAGTGRNKQIEEGTDTLTDRATGELVEFRRKHNSYFNRDPYLSGSWALERGSDNAYRAQRALAAEPVRLAPGQPRHAHRMARSTTTI